MIEKKVLFLMLFFLLLAMPICASHQVYHDSNVVVFGKCRTIYSMDGWTGGVFNGFTSGFGASSNQAEGEDVRIFIREDGASVFRAHTNYFSFVARNASGFFLWNIRQIYLGECPLIIVACHADSVYIELY